MNHQSSVDSPVSSFVDTDPISRRAYELWEKEGRPEGCDLRHWLQAEQELSVSRSDSGIRSDAAASASNPTNTGSDVRPLQGTRAAAAASREHKRGSTNPFGKEKTSPSNGNAQLAARRKPAGTPPL